MIAVCLPGLIARALRGAIGTCAIIGAIVTYGLTMTVIPVRAGGQRP